MLFEFIRILNGKIQENNSLTFGEGFTLLNLLPFLPIYTHHYYMHPYIYVCVLVVSEYIAQNIANRKK